MVIVTESAGAKNRTSATELCGGPSFTVQLLFGQLPNGDLTVHAWYGSIVNATDAVALFL
jgi:hypothetical protein